MPSECVTSFWCITLEWQVWPGRMSKYNNFSWVIGDLDDEEPVAPRSSQVLRSSKVLINLKIWLLFWNVLELNFFLDLAWTIFKDLVLWHVFLKMFFYSIIQNMFSLYLTKYIKMLTFPTIISKEKENKVNWEDLRGLCIFSTNANHPVKGYHFKIYNHLVSNMKRNPRVHGPDICHLVEGTVDYGV